MKSNVAIRRESEVEVKPIPKRKTTIKVMRGIGASSGVAVAPCRVISRTEDLGTVKKGEILIFRTASPDLTLYMDRLKGLVTEVGGRLTTAAHYARLQNVPHVAGSRI